MITRRYLSVYSLNTFSSYVRAVKKLNKLSFAYSRMPWLWIPLIWSLSGYKAAYEKNLKIVTDFTKKVISDRKQDFDIDNDSEEFRPKQRVFLDILLSIQKEGDLTDADVRDEVETFMFEGD